jgi:hypothetical protein
MFSQHRFPSAVEFFSRSSHFWGASGGEVGLHRCLSAQRRRSSRTDRTARTSGASRSSRWNESRLLRGGRAGGRRGALAQFKDEVVQVGTYALEAIDESGFGRRVRGWSALQACSRVGRWKSPWASLAPAHWELAPTLSDVPPDTLSTKTQNYLSAPLEFGLTFYGPGGEKWGAVAENVTQDLSSYESGCKDALFRDLRAFYGREEARCGTRALARQRGGRGLLRDSASR